MRRLIPFMRPGKGTAATANTGAKRTADLQPPERTDEAGMKRPARRPSLRIVVTGAMMAGLLATGIFAYAERGRLSTGFVTASADAGLRLQIIEVQGRAHTPKEVLIAASELTLGQPMLTSALPALHERLATIGWVRESAVERPQLRGPGERAADEARSARQHHHRPDLVCVRLDGALARAIAPHLDGIVP